MQTCRRHDSLVEEIRLPCLHAAADQEITTRVAQACRQRRLRARPGTTSPRSPRLAGDQEAQEQLISRSGLPPRVHLTALPAGRGLWTSTRSRTRSSRWDGRCTCRARSSTGRRGWTTSAHCKTTRGTSRGAAQPRTARPRVARRGAARHSPVRHSPARYSPARRVALQYGAVPCRAVPRGAVPRGAVAMVGPRLTCKVATFSRDVLLSGSA